MKLPRHHHLFSRKVAFSLPEVTIAMGVIAAVLLPALAMLAGAGSMQTLARDREMASRIARLLISSMAPNDREDHFEIAFKGSEVLDLDLPPAGGSTTIFAAFDKKGIFLRDVSAAEFQAGLSATEKALHIVSLRLSWQEDKTSLARKNPSLLGLSLTIEQPAAAPELSRTREIFQARLSAP